VAPERIASRPTEIDSTIGFCVGIAHAEAVAGAFGEPGYRAESVDGKMHKAERARRIGGLAAGEVEVLTNCALIAEGVDVPAISAVVLLRPTKSLALHLQQIGRGLRIAPGKDSLTVNDDVGNVLTHGLPTDWHEWTLDGVTKRPGEAPVKVCPECDCANPLSARICEQCGHEFPAPERPPARSSDLVEITPERLAYLRALKGWPVNTLHLTEPELRAVADARKYKPGWIRHRLREQAAAAAEARS
jgi:DNA repair protein RadD